MSLELKTTVIISQDAVSFRIKDASTGWGTGGDPASGAIQKAVLGITGQHLDAAVYIDITSSWADFLSADGKTILAAEVLATWLAFPDGYYEIKLYINTDGQEIIVNGAVVDGNVDFSYLNTQGFMVWARNLWRRLPTTLDLDNFDYLENRKIYMIRAFIESCESAGAVARSNDFINMQRTIASEFNLRGITYEYTS
jgi:hypothetical protein